MFQFARLYAAGQGVEKDLVQAMRWLTALSRLSSQADPPNVESAACPDNASNVFQE